MARLGLRRRDDTGFGRGAGVIRVKARIIHAVVDAVVDAVMDAATDAAINVAIDVAIDVVAEAVSATPSIGIGTHPASVLFAEMNARVYEFYLVAGGRAD